jgi:hypothetical protein
VAAVVAVADADRPILVKPRLAIVAEAMNDVCPSSQIFLRDGCIVGSGRRKGTSIMRTFTGVGLLVALLGFIAACTIITTVVAMQAATAVTFTTFGSGDSLYADDWEPCESAQSFSCD